MKDKILKRRYNAQRKWKEALVKLKGDRCALCGGQYPICCYDFHHINPKLKEKNIAQYTHTKEGFKKAKQELYKCLLLCGNCHRLIHAWGGFYWNGDLRVLKIRPKWGQPFDKKLIEDF